MRTFDATAHNFIANHPQTIRALEWNPDKGPLVFDKLAADPAFYALLHNGTRDIAFEEVEGGVFPADFPTLALIFEWSAPGIWQVHTMSRPEARGTLVEDAKRLMYEMFVQHGADMIWGQTPITNIAARKFNVKIGAEIAGQGLHHVSGPVEYFRNSRARWLRDHWSSDDTQ